MEFESYGPVDKWLSCCLRSTSVVAEPTSTGCCATFKAELLGSMSTFHFGPRRTEGAKRPVDVCSARTETECRPTGLRAPRRDCLWRISLMVRTEDSQSSDIGFNSHIRHCGCRTMASTSDCGSDDASSILAGHILCI